MGALKDTPLGRLFPVPFLQHLWDEGEAVNPELRRSILDREAAQPGERKSNSGGWQSPADFQEWPEPAAGRLMQAMLRLVDQATLQLLGPKIATQQFGWKASAWANVNRTGQYNRLHSHPGCTWSAVYYVDAGEEPPAAMPWAGNICFVNPNGGSIMSFFPDILPNTTEIRPKSGLMIVFPSYLNHSVHPYEGGRSRISIAFNFTKDPYP
jgi:uncharacterized protein (TIGR02466 family)